MKVSKKRFIEVGEESGIGPITTEGFYIEYDRKGLDLCGATMESHPIWCAFVESLHREEKLLMLEAAMEVIGD